VEYDPKECQGGWILTNSGLKFFPLDPKPDQICIEDIAHALSQICRWVGHTNEFYSVAQHCFLVSQMCPPDLALWGLLHDATEAYIGDVNRPLKLCGRLDAYGEIEDNLMAVIAKKYGLSGTVVPKAVKEVDNRLLNTEAIQLLHPLAEGWHIADPYDFHICPVHPRVAREVYIKTFNNLMGAVNGLTEIAK
jgi:uncharacterized protein